MAIKKTRWKKGIVLTPDTDALEGIEGELKVDSSDNKIKTTLDSTSQEIATIAQTQTLTNKTIDADNNTISELELDNLKSGVLNTDAGLSGASDTQVPSALAAKDYADSVANNVQSNLDDHEAETEVHGVGVGNEVVGTGTTQTLENKEIVVANNTITTQASGNLSATELNAALAELDSEITSSTGDKVVGPASSTDNAVARFDSTTGKLLQDSNVIINDSDEISGINKLDVDNLSLDSNTLSSTNTDGDINISPDGTGSLVVTKDASFEDLVSFSESNDTTTGSNATLSAVASKIVRLTDASLVSVDMIPANKNGQELTIINSTGNIITINNDTGATAANRILTGIKAPLQLKDEASISLTYSSTESRWMVIGGTGSGDGSGGINYITNSDAEAGIDPWTTYVDAAGETPVDGTGGSATITLTQSSADPLRGTESFLESKDAANRQGEGVSVDFDIENADLANALSISFNYEVSSNYEDGDLRVFIYDITNDNLIEPVNIDIKASNVPNKHVSVFQTAPDSTSYRLIIHTATTNASAYTFKFDNVSVGPGISTGTFNNSQSYRMVTFSGYGSTNNKIPYFSTETGNEGSNLFSISNSSVTGFSVTALQDCTVVASLAMNVTGGTVFGWSLNSNQLTTDLSSITATDRLSWVVCDTGGFGKSATVNIKLKEGDVLRPHTSGTAVSTANRCTILITAEGIQETKQVQAQTRSTELDMSGVGNFLTGSIKVSKIGSQVTISATSTITNSAVVQPSTGASFLPDWARPANTQRNVFITTNNRGLEFIIEPNGAVVLRSNQLSTGAGASDTSFGNYGTITYDTGEDINGIQGFAFDTSIVAIYNTGAGASIANTGSPILNFDNKVKDTHNAVTTGASWKFTAPESGFYHVSFNYAFVDFTRASNFRISNSINVNGSQRLHFLWEDGASSVTSRIGAGGDGLVYLNKGDEVDLSVDQNNSGSIALEAVEEWNNISIYRV